MYAIYLPSAALRPFIECYWFLNTVVMPPESLDELIFTDARADIVFTFGSPYARIRLGQPDQLEFMCASNVDAQRRYPVRIRQHGSLNLVGVRFRPGGLASFIRMPVYELSGHTLGLLDGLGRESAELEERLFEATGSPHVQSELLDEFLLARLSVHPERRRVMHWVNVIEHHRGVISVRRLAEIAGLSVRSVDRLFRQVVGLSPKFFARTVRFRHVHKRLMQEPGGDPEEIVASYGYHDYSHFVKDFTSLAGVDPKEYSAYLAAKRQSPPPNHVQFLQDERGPSGL